MNALALPLKSTWPSSSSVPCSRHAGIEDRVELVAVGAAEIQLDQFIDLRSVVDLVAVERGLEIVQLVRVGLLAEDRRPVIVVERLLDRFRVVHEVEHEYIVLLRMRAVEPRQRLHRLDAREQLVHVHRVQQRLVVSGLELVGADQEPVWVLLNLVGDLV